MAISTIGGALAAALLAVFVLPALYLRFAPVVLPEAAAADVVVMPELDHVPES
jgi:hypothetical protein